MLYNLNKAKFDYYLIIYRLLYDYKGLYLKNEAEILIDRMMNRYDVFTISELAQRINTSQPAISQWKKKNYIKAIASKCRELGIYDEIFKDTRDTKMSKKETSEAYISYLEDMAQENDPNYLDSMEHEFLSEPISKIDFATYIIFKEAYIKAIKNDDLKGFRIHLMDY